MLGRQRSGSVVCRSCGRLVGVNDTTCYECGARYPGLWGFAPVFRRLGEDLGFTKLTIGVCTLLYVASLLLNVQGIGMRGFLGILSPAPETTFLLGAAGRIPVLRYGRWWTVLSAGWLHGSLLHIFFNMYWVRTLAPPVARLYGAGRMVIIYTVGSVLGFVLSSTAPYVPLIGGAAPLTLGASAALMGLLGALVYYGRRGGSSEVSRWAWGYAIFFFVFGLVAQGVDNWAHLGGFAGGWIAARLLDPLKPERIDHIVAALVCLGASALAVLASVLTAMR